MASISSYDERIKYIIVGSGQGCQRDVKIELTDGRSASLILLIPTIDCLTSSISAHKIKVVNNYGRYCYDNPHALHPESRKTSEIFDDIFGRECAEQTPFKKVQPTLLERVRNIVLIVFSAGIFLAIQQYRFVNAIEIGDLQTASSALRYGAYPYMSKAAIWKIAKAKDVETLRFLAAQQSFSNDSSFIQARDQLKDGEIRRRLIQIVPFSRHPETFLRGMPEGWAPGDEYSFGEIQTTSTNPCPGHFYDSHWDIARIKETEIR